MIPIRDDNPTFHLPRVTIGLIVVNVLVFIVEIGQPDLQAFIWRYGFVPAELVRSGPEFRELMEDGAREEIVVDARGRRMTDMWGRPLVRRVPLPYSDAVALPAWMNIFTCMFLHGGWMHLLGNMLYLWIFGNNVEDRLGPIFFSVFYLATGVAGNLAHALVEASVVPLVGASGAISGVMGGYILLFPHARVLAVIPWYFYWFTVRLPAWVFLGVYFVFQNIFPALGGALTGHQSNVAFLAHIGGFVGGMALIHVFPHRQPPRWARRVARPIHEEDVDFDV